MHPDIIFVHLRRRRVSASLPSTRIAFHLNLPNVPLGESVLGSFGLVNSSPGLLALRLRSGGLAQRKGKRACRGKTSAHPRNGMRPIRINRSSITRLCPRAGPRFDRQPAIICSRGSVLQGANLVMRSGSRCRGGWSGRDAVRMCRQPGSLADRLAAGQGARQGAAGQAARQQSQAGSQGRQARPMREARIGQLLGLTHAHSDFEGVNLPQIKGSPGISQPGILSCMDSCVSLPIHVVRIPGSSVSRASLFPGEIHPQNKNRLGSNRILAMLNRAFADWP